MSNNKTLLFLSPYCYPCVTGGIEVFNYNLIEKLSELYTIRLITLCESLPFENVIVHSRNKHIPLKISWPFFVIFNVLKYRKSIGLIYFSHARGHWFYWLMIILIRKLLGINYGFTMHGGSNNSKKHKFPFESLGKNAAFITGVSIPIVTETNLLFDNKVVFTPPLIPFHVVTPKNIFRTEWGIKSNDLTILYVGSLKPLKAVDSLIEALGIISINKLKKHNIKVLIAGDGISKDELQKRTSELNLDPYVNFLGNIPREKIHELYNIADIYTICSEFEGTPISMLEAFANEIPCITSNGPGLIELSNSNANTLLFETRNAMDYAGKMEELIVDSKLQHRLIKNAKEYYENHYSYNNMVNKYSKELDKYLLK